jgi:cytidylate kinase
MAKNTAIAIDGYSSCGKSTVAKALARKLNYVYVDSGAMYRAVTLYFLRNGTDISNTEAVKDALSRISVDLISLNGASRVLLNGEDVSDEIREMAVSEQVSEVSALKAVREAMVRQQQLMGSEQDVVMDGRDIGTMVFPDAAVKIFMTADPYVRAERRYKELSEKGQQITLEEVFENIQHRDHYDTTRQESPLTRADDAIILDNTHMNEEEQLQFIACIVAERSKRD